MSFDFDDLEEKAAQKSTPVFVAWYSGGFSAKDGEALLEPLTTAVKMAFPAVDVLVLHYPDVYNIEGEGSEPWPTYVDRLVEEIDKEPSRKDRPLILFGHSRGNAPCMTLAARLGARVLKIYIAATPAPIPGQPSPFKALSDTFKQTGDVGLLQWFVGLNPGNLMMEGMCKGVVSGEMKIEDSPFLNSMMTLMRRQYRDAMWPDMERDFKGVVSPILAFGPRLDLDVSLETMQGWGLWTTGGAKVKMISGAGHMDCLRPSLVDGEVKCILIETLLKDMESTMRAAAA